jgi:hypothetical protein
MYRRWSTGAVSVYVESAARSGSAQMVYRCLVGCLQARGIIDLRGSRINKRFITAVLDFG